MRRFRRWVNGSAVLFVALAVLGLVIPHFDHVARSRWLAYAGTLAGTYLVCCLSLLRLRGLGRALRERRQVRVRGFGRPMTVALWCFIAAVGVLWLGLRQYVLPVAGGMLGGADLAIATAMLLRGRSRERRDFTAQGSSAGTTTRTRVVQLPMEH